MLFSRTILNQSDRAAKEAFIIAREDIAPRKR